MVRILKLRYIRSDTKDKIKEKINAFIDLVVDSIVFIIHVLWNIDRVILYFIAVVKNKSICYGVEEIGDDLVHYFIIGDDVFSMDIPSNIEAVCFQRIDGREYKVLYLGGRVSDVYVRSDGEWKKMRRERV